MTTKNDPVEPEFDLSGGDLCLDFANTVSHRKSPGQEGDRLAGYDELFYFVRDAGVLSPQFAREILDVSALKPGERATVFEAAIHLREAIYRVFAAIAASRTANRKDLKLIEDRASQAMSHRHLVAVGGEYRWEWKREKQDLLTYSLWPIAQSAGDLLTSETAGKVRQCAAPACTWLFLDESRNHSRRWCDMSVCGNRQKARRHYERQR